MTSEDQPSGTADRGDKYSSIPPMGTLVIRSWLEPTQVPGFRARITYSQTGDDEPNTVTTADPDEVLAVVRRWLLAKPGSSSGV